MKNFTIDSAIERLQELKKLHGGETKLKLYNRVSYGDCKILPVDLMTYVGGFGKIFIASSEDLLFDDYEYLQQQNEIK